MTRTSSDLRHHLARTSAVRALGAAAGTVALAVALASCSGGGDAPGVDTASPQTSASASSAPMSSAAVSPDPVAVASASSAVATEHDDADTAFAQQMIVHHQGAVRMAQLAEDRSENAAVKELASRIEAAQTPEIALMTGWLQAWGAPPTASGGGTDMGSMGMGEQDGAALEQASGADFDRLFLQQMTVHHQGAVDMSKTEQADGQNPQAIELAGSIVASQTAEIQEMAQLAQTLQG